METEAPHLRPWHKLNTLYTIVLNNNTFDYILFCVSAIWWGLVEQIIIIDLSVVF